MSAYYAAIRSPMHHETKAKLTLAEHQVRAVEKSRSEWRDRFKRAEEAAQEAGAALEEANQRTTEALARLRRLEMQLDEKKKGNS